MTKVLTLKSYFKTRLIYAILSLLLDFVVFRKIDIYSNNIRDYFILFFYISVILSLFLFTIINLMICKNLIKYRKIDSKDVMVIKKNKKYVSMSSIYDVLYFFYRKYYVSLWLITRYDLKQWKLSLFIIVLESCFAMFSRASIHMYGPTVIGAIVPWVDVFTNYLFLFYILRRDISREDMIDGIVSENESHEKKHKKFKNSVSFGTEW